MSSLRPEEDKLHSLGRQDKRWKNLFIGGIDANETINLNISDPSTNALNIIQGSVSILNGDLLIKDNLVNPNQTINVLEKLKNLETSVQNANNAANADKLDNLDSTDFVRSTGNVPQNITGIKDFKDSINFNNLFVTGTIDQSPSNTNIVPNVAWINNKLNTITINNASESEAGKVELATNAEAEAGTNLNGSSPLVIRPSQLKQAVDTLNNRITDELIGQLNYRGALDFSFQNNSASLTSLQSSLQDDFWYVKVAGSIIVESQTISLLIGDIIIFKQDADDPLLLSMFDIIPNTSIDQITFNLIKSKLTTGENPTFDYFAKGLTSNKLIDINTINNQSPTYLTSNDFLKTSGSNSSVSNSNYDFSLSTSHLVPNINITVNPPTGNDLNKSLNINSLNSYISNHLILDNLKDVLISNLTNNQFLQYSNGTWKNQTLNITTTLSSLTDVTISNIQDNQVLTYSTSAQKWINSNNNSSIDLTPYARKDTNNSFTGANIFSKEITTTLTFFPTNLIDYNTTSPIYNNSLNRFNNTVVTSEWIHRNSLTNVFIYPITSNIDINTYLKTQNPSYDDSTDNYSIYNDLLFVINGTSLQNNQNVILPDYFRSVNTSTFKTGFSIKIKLLNSPTYSIFIIPQTGQRIDGILNNQIEMTDYSSLTFTVSGNSSFGWIVS